jgi:hypothetical protein
VKFLPQLTTPLLTTHPLTNEATPFSLPGLVDAITVPHSTEAIHSSKLQIDFAKQKIKAEIRTYLET